MFLLRSRLEPQNKKATIVIAFKPGLHGFVISKCVRSILCNEYAKWQLALCRKMYNEAEIIVL